MTISERMFFILEEKSLKSVDLANILGVGTGQISTWKKRNTDPPAKYIPQICEFLGISTSFLLTGVEAIPRISKEDEEWLRLIHALPTDVRMEIKGEMKGYLKYMEKSVAADNSRTGTDNLGKSYPSNGTGGNAKDSICG